ncbi:hypothetical protein RSPPQCQH_CDS0047 [Mycolicibacterium phage phi1_186001]
MRPAEGFTIPGRALFCVLAGGHSVMVQVPQPLVRNTMR